MGEGKGLPRATFNYHAFCRNVRRKGDISSNLCNYKIVKIGKVKGLPWVALCYDNLVGMGEGKGLSRATFTNHRIKEMWEKKGLP
jgi:hypothetical protein